MEKSLRKTTILRIQEGRQEHREEILAVEEPLEIQLGMGKPGQRRYQSLAVTMRTPGHDFELALGFLYTEGLIGRRADVVRMRYAGERLHPQAQENVLLVELAKEVTVDFQQLSRHFYTSSSCGVCGKGSIEMASTTIVHLLHPVKPRVPAGVICRMPEQLRRFQGIFSQTGGIHAAGLFSVEGDLVLLREDVGRHNALDKLVGAALEEDRIPVKDSILLLSGRAGFELVQKALMAGIPILAAVGAPSSLAMELAEEYGMTLIGFLRNGRFNVYCGEQRLLV